MQEFCIDDHCVMRRRWLFDKLNYEYEIILYSKGQYCIIDDINDQEMIQLYRISMSIAEFEIEFTMMRKQYVNNDKNVETCI